MDVMPGYKHTDIGVIPDDWNVKSMESIGSVIRGSSPRPKGDKRFYGGNVPRLLVEDVTRDKRWITPSIDFLTEEGAKQSRPCKRGTLTIVCSGTPTVVGLPSLLAVDACIHDGMLALINLDKGIAPDFLFHQLTSCQLQLHASATHGGTFVNLTTSALKAFKVALPPTKSEQEAIAEALSDADFLIESLEQLIAKKRYIRIGALQQLLHPKDDWIEKTLGNTAVLKARIGWQGLTTAEYLDTGYYYLVTGTDFKSGYIDWAHCHFVDESRYKQDTNIQLRNHDVVVTKDGTIGKVALIHDLDKPATLNSGVFVIRPIERAFNPDFFYYLLCSEVFAGFLTQLSAGSTINHLYQKDFVNFIYKTPPTISEQEEFASILSNMDAEIAALESKLVKYRQLKQGMMHNLLTGKIRLVAQSLVEVKPVAATSDESTASPIRGESHTWAFNEAVIISVLANQFGKPEFPLGRMRYTKLSYLIHRKAEREALGYLKKAAGPYNPSTKYAGPEKIALESGYVRRHERGKFKGFIAAEKIEQAKIYFAKWYDPTITAWLEQFRFRSNDELECLTTVDMAMQELLKEDKTADVESVRALIGSEPEWLPKLQRLVFSDSGIASAIAESHALFGP